MVFIANLMDQTCSINRNSVSGGALLSPESIATPDAQKKMVGSTITLLADSLEDARKIIESDIYYTSKVVSNRREVILDVFVN